jgi:hypothetical protein
MRVKSDLSEIKHPFSVIDGRKIKVKQAFSWVLNYYNPLKGKNKMARVLDTTASQMLMWDEEDLKKFYVKTNDINPDYTDLDYGICCSKLHLVVNGCFNILVYDPPYIDLENREDTEKYEKAFNYVSMKTPEDLKTLTQDSAYCFYQILDNNGILIAKITDFHWENRLRGAHDFINWFKDYFYIYDIIIYRFFKHIPNLNWYKRKVAKTHSYFLIFKKRKQSEIEKEMF